MEKEKISETSKREIILTAACIFVAVLFLVSFVIINFGGFPRFCNSDMYEDLYVSRLMWEQKTIFPKGWIFGNQYYAVATPVWAALIYGICGSMNTATLLATTLMSVFIICSAVWMLRAFTGERLHICLALAVLLGVMPGPQIVHSEPGQIFYLCASYYACYLITCFVVTGTYLRELQEKKWRPVPYILGLVLCFGTGMQSLRQTTVMVLPLLFVEAVRNVSVYMKTKKLDQENVRIALRTLGYAFTNGCGYITLKLINPAHHSIFGNMTPRTSAGDILDGIKMGLRYLSRVNGLSYLFYQEFRVDYLLLGIYCMPFLLGVIAFAAGSIRKGFREAAGKCGAVLVMGLAATYAVGCVFKVTLRPIYFFLWYPLVMVSVVWALGKLKGRLRTVYVAAVLALLLGNYAISYVSSVQEALSGEMLEEEQVCRYMQENGYEYLYGPWVVAPEIAVYSDGEIIAGGWYEEVFVVLDYLNPHGIYAPEDNEKALIVLKRADMDEALQAAAERGAALTQVYETEKYVLYKASEQLMIE
ncbi:MAG: hypothetical protein IJ600_02040 [Lachnospiraceae bacterium]|nr:hypothetical protein [Lachnospiraceae bacterium]